MGNGQYYDPSTGRFLTRGANADQSNPYTPWNSDPSGMLIAPLALLALVFGKKKNRTKLDHFVILIVIGLSVGLSMSACGVETPTVQPTAIPTATPTPPIGNTSSSSGYTDIGKYDGPRDFVVLGPNPTCTVTPSPIPTYTFTPTITPTPAWWQTSNNTAVQTVTVNGVSMPKIYWNGMDQNQLGAVQKYQGVGRNDCALFAIAASFNLLENQTNKYDGHIIAYTVDALWGLGIKNIRFWRNSATFPKNQIEVINTLNDINGTNYSASIVNNDRDLMKQRLLDQDSLQLITVYYAAPITIIRDDQKSVEKYIFNGHTMVLVAYDPTHVDLNGISREWGVVNSWSNGGKIYWISDADLAMSQIVEVRK